MAVPVSLLGLIPIGYIIAESYALGWAGAQEALFRPRVADLLGNTLALVGTCLLGCVLLGVVSAWLVERTDLPGRRVWAAVLVAPLAVPAFVNSYAWASLWPQFEGLPAATTITVLSYYPFVYLPAAAVLRGLDPVLEETGAALGLGPVERFVRVVLPQLRVAILGGGLLVGLHILAEFGALQMIGYETFTTVILVQFQSTFNGAAATMLAGVLVACSLLFVTLEVLARGGARYARVGAGAARLPVPVRLDLARWPVVAVLGGLLVAAVGVPVYAVARWWSYDTGIDSELMTALFSTLRFGLIGAAVTTLAALPLAWLAVRRRNLASTALEQCAYLTSSLPGVVVALALVTLTVRWADSLYQTTAVVAACYLMLFLPRSLVNLRAGLAQASPELDDAARALGSSEVKRLVRVTLPLIAPGVAGGAAFVFLAVCTELTATLLLAPNGTTTLATQFWAHSDSLDYAAAAPYAAVMIAISVPLAYLMLEQSRRLRRR
ncbi:MAG TPA: iron ABC transporter permease [Propionibacteriaceae bacterium]|nr:iron ABC transporter permease [Propionibacteriaceae bacterium]